MDLLDVDGAAISLVHAGATRGTFGSSSTLSRRLDAHQFTLGEGPCLDAVQEGRPVVAEEDPWNELGPLERVEAYQAAGFLIAQCATGPAEALLRLRARAFSTGRTALELARDVVEGRSWVDGDGEWQRAPGHGEDPG